jgi:hypothetical protein
MNVTLRRLCNYCCNRKAISVTRSDSMCFGLRYVAWKTPVRLYNIFPHYHIKPRFSKKKLLSIKSVFWVSLQHLSETFLIQRRTERDAIKMFSDIHIKYLLLLSDYNKTKNFLDRFSKNTQISTLMKIRPVGAELFHADGQTDSTTDGHNEPNSRFLQFFESV